MTSNKNTIIVLLLSLCLFYVAVANGATTEQEKEQTIVSGYQQLAVDQEKNKLADKRYKRLRRTMQEELSTLTSNSITEKKLADVNVRLRQAQVNLDSVNIAISNTRFARSDLRHIVNEMQRNFHEYTLAVIKADDQPIDKALKEYQKRLDYQQSLLDLEESRLNVLYDSRKTLEESVTLIREWQMKLLNLKQAQSIEKRNKNLTKTITALQTQRQTWLAKAVEYNSELKTIDNRGARNDRWVRLELKFFEAEQNASIIQLKINLAQIKNDAQNLPLIENENYTIARLNALAERLNDLLDQLVNLNTSITKKITTLEQRANIWQGSQAGELLSQSVLASIKASFNELTVEYKALRVEAQSLDKVLRVYQKSLRNSIGAMLSQRQAMPGLNWHDWRNLFSSIAIMPALTVQSFYAMYEHFSFMLKQASIWRLLGMVFMAVGFGALWYFSRFYLDMALRSITRRGKRIATNLVYLLCQVLRRSMTDIIVLGGILLLLYASGFASRSLTIYAYLVVVWVCFRVAIIIAKIALLESMGDTSGRDVRLYHNLKWSLLVGGVITAFTVLAHELILPYDTREFFNWLFMVFLFMVSAALLRHWRLYPELLQPLTKHAPVYVQRTVTLLSFLIPMTLLSNAILGIVGFVGLAWAISRYELLFLLVLSLYLIFRGLWVDGTYWLSNFMIRNIPNGWLWTQAFLKPLDKLCSVLLFLGAWMFLFSLYGWGEQSIVLQRLYEIFTYPLFHITESPISLASFAELIVLIALFFWASKWTREFSYRWFFLNVKDHGVRNSLSMFCQYFIVIVGVFVTLKLLGIGLTGLTVIAGGMAVAIGFGLRDLANNFVSGIFLLLERPVRAGDLVSIGTYEGEVSSIGMRSITMSTWDHMEVLVPNSDVFSKPFTNWTLQDSIVRSVISVKVNRKDDVHDVQALIYEVLAGLDLVLTQPAPQVFLTEIDDALIEFEVRYYINLQVKPRAEVRSIVLFSLWSSFDEHGIQPPHPKQDVFIKELPDKRSPDESKRAFFKRPGQDDTKSDKEES